VYIYASTPYSDIDKEIIKTITELILFQSSQKVLETFEEQILGADEKK